MIKKNKITKVLIAFLVFLQWNAIGQNERPYSIGKTYKIHSKILKEERNYILELPSSYETSNNNYPILVLLDGEVNYHSHSGILKHM